MKALDIIEERFLSIRIHAWSETGPIELSRSGLNPSRACITSQPQGTLNHENIQSCYLIRIETHNAKVQQLGIRTPQQRACSLFISIPGHDFEQGDGICTCFHEKDYEITKPIRFAHIQEIVFGVDVQYRERYAQPLL